MSKISGLLATWTGLLSAIAGGAFGLQTYRDDVKKSVDGSLLQAFAVIRDYNGLEMQGLRTKASALTRARQLCDVRAAFGYDMTATEARAFIGFFDLAHDCAARGLCDPDAMADHFGPEANEVWPAFKAYVLAARAGDEREPARARFGRGFEAFATEPVALPACDANFADILDR